MIPELLKQNYNHESNGRSSEKKILVVEDHHDCREILALLLTQIGYHVIKAQNSKDAIVCGGRGRSFYGYGAARRRRN